VQSFLLTIKIIGKKSIRDRVRNSSSSKKRKDLYNCELQKYMKLPAIKRDDDAMAWWRQNIVNLNCLKPMVLKYLCAPPSSVASERQFSTAGDIYTETRNRLLPENADRLIFITKNKKIL